LWRRSKRSASRIRPTGFCSWRTTTVSHHARITQERADELGTEFVFIPPYSPTLNAIEPLWKNLKREISPTIFEDKDHFREFLTETFLRLSHRLSFAVDWIDTFLPGGQILR
jgi:transposase